MCDFRYAKFYVVATTHTLSVQIDINFGYIILDHDHFR